MNNFHTITQLLNNLSQNVTHLVARVNDLESHVKALETGTGVAKNAPVSQSVSQYDEKRLQMEVMKAVVSEIDKSSDKLKAYVDEKLSKVQAPSSFQQQLVAAPPSVAVLPPPPVSQVAEQAQQDVLAANSVLSESLTNLDDEISFSLKEDADTGAQIQQQQKKKGGRKPKK